MQMLLNKRVHKIPDDAVYIGRPSKWGNPYVKGRDGDRAEVVRRHRELMCASPDFMDAIRRELRGKVLVCFCALYAANGSRINPGACHGDIYIEIANREMIDVS